MDDQVKSIFASRTFWGAVVAMAANALAAGRHITISPADQSVLVNVIIEFIGAAGALYAMYGRTVATKKVTSP